MKATKVFYQKCFNLGNYQNEVVGIELEIGEGEKAVDVLQKAMQFVELRDHGKIAIEEYNHCLQVINDPDNYTGRQVKEATQKLQKMEQIEELPF